MTRLVLEKNDRLRFFYDVKQCLQFSSDKLGPLIGMSGRNYRDWVQGKILPTRVGIELLSKISGVPTPPILEEREEWWSGRVNGHIGANARLRKYGVTLTLQDRTKGGHNSQLRRAANPEYYRELGCTIPNTFIIPTYSEKLAEFIGIVLGDGCLTSGQCQISLHMIDDREYAVYVQILINDLFGAYSSISSYIPDKVIKVVVSGVEFTKLLESFGIQKGHKIKHQVDIPLWVKENPVYVRACMRGLFDTDGGTFTHSHLVSGHRYVNFGLTFTSASIPLLSSYKLGLSQNHFDVHSHGPNIFLYGVKTAQRFIETFNPSNPRTVRRLNHYLAQRGQVK